MKLIDGKRVSNEILKQLKCKHEDLNSKYYRQATLTVILVGDDYASKIYVRNKERACEKVGIKTKTVILDENIKKEDLINIIEKENKDEEVDGILLQLPLPKHLDQLEIMSHIDYKKDVDGFSPFNIGKMLLNQSGLRPCTALGVIKLLEEYKIPIKGSDVVIIGRSNIVGKPLAMMLTNRSATVQLCHSKTENIDEKIKRADILITAAGYPKLINKTLKLKKGVCIIDVGINRLEGKLCGDVAIDEINTENVEYITPVPGGVGPMTIACLLENVTQIYEGKVKNESI